MKEKTKQEKTSKWSIYSEMIRPLDPEKGITVMDYLNALDCNVKESLRTAYEELGELINELPKDEMEKADSFLSIQRGAFMLWEQIDKKVMAGPQG